MLRWCRNNSSVPLTANDSIRTEIDQYVAKINFTLAFIQPFILLFGLLGNLLALIVINKKALRNTSSAVFINYMAIFDSGVLLVHAANLVRPRRNLFLHCSLTYLTDLTTFCANWILVIITLERCVAVSSPILARRFCTTRTARRSVGVLVATAVLFFSSIFPIFYHTNNASDGQKCVIRSHLQLIYRVYHFLVHYGIPDLLLLSNLCTIYVLFQRRKLQEQRCSDLDAFEMRIYDVHSNRKQRQLTIMLVTINITFYLLTTPAAIMHIAEYCPPNTLVISNVKRSFVLSQISVLLLQLNNATNFIFYCITGQRFRQATMETLHEYSTRLLVFYHRYILCNKLYRPPIDYQLQRLPYTPTNRISNPEILKTLHSTRTSTI